MQLPLPAVHRRILGTWFLSLTLLGIFLTLNTGDESPVTPTLPRSPQLTVEPSRCGPQTTTWNDALVGLLVPAAVVFLLLIARPTDIEVAPRPPLEEKDDQFWEGNATCYPHPSVSQVECEPAQGYTLDVTEEHQAEKEVPLMVLSDPADISPNVDTLHPAVPSPARYHSGGSNTSLKDAIESESLSFGHLFHNDDEDEEEYDEAELLAPIKHCSFKFPPAPLRANQPQCGVPLEPTSQVSDSSTLGPQAHGEPKVMGTAPSAQVSGTVPDAGSLGAFKLGLASSSTSTPRKPHHSDAALSAQVSGTASKTGFLGKLRVKCKAAAASAKRSRVIVQAGLGRIKTAGKRGFKSREAAVPEQLSDSNLSPSAPAPISPLSTEDTEETEQKPKKVVRFSHFVQVGGAPRSRFDEFARTGFKDRETEREMRRAYRAWVKGKGREVDSDSDDVGYFFVDDGDIDDGGFSRSDQEKAVANSRRSAQFRRGGRLAFYGASTSRDGSRQLSEAEWQELDEFQAVRSGTSLDLDVVIEVIYKILLKLTEPPQTPPATANRRSFGSSTKRGWRRLRRAVSGFLC